ncbi:MAG: DUF3710 domain-containing protein [Corynebacteriales bacterium]|nr:DUF3710 domain-containing protein [Mycobacteriales bacterium]
MFFRSKKSGKHGADREDGVSVDELVSQEPEVELVGPFDVEDEPEDDSKRIDLGALRIPPIPGTEMRLESSDKGAVTGVMVMESDQNSGVHLTAYAAPRSGGLWAESRADLLAEIAKSGGQVSEADGEFGVELRAVLETPNGPTPARFIGVDGPRWLLRAVFSGKAGDPDNAEVLTQVVRGTVVVRGESPMPAGDVLLLKLPQEVTEAAERQAAEGEEEKNARPRMAAPVRGIETTEIR